MNKHKNPMSPNGIQIGMTVRCTISGFEGVVNSLTFYRPGTVSANVVSQKLNKRTDKTVDDWIETAQLTIVSKDAPFSVPEAFDAPAEIGDTVKDTTNDDQGVVISIGYWLHGCIRYQVKSPKYRDHDNKPVLFWVDAVDIERVEEVERVPPPEEPTGGPGERHSPHN